jgi:CRISPR system Cascade subunit CasA
MTFNLIEARWLPVRRLSGRRDYVRPADIIDRLDTDPIVALDFPRPDWNAAVTEWLIGVLAVVIAPRDAVDWHRTWANPPSPDALHAQVQRIAFAFDLDGDGPRCLQDRDPLADSDDKPVAALFIDAAGEQTEKKNTDLFVKRSTATGLSLPYAAAALITLQTYAPAGGQGNRTGLRGGGPLTTLPAVHRARVGGNSTRIITLLWDLVWASVPDRVKIGDAPATPDDPDWALIFPWRAPTRTSETNRATTPDDAHHLQQFFGMPRRIRLTFGPAGNHRCALDGPVGDVLVRSFRQKNYGVKYEGWEHVLSPNRPDKKAGKLPLHPQPGGATYRDWMTWVAAPSGDVTRAACIQAWDERLKRIKDAGDAVSLSTDVWQSSVVAFGYDMDNMKARGWLEARIPFFHPPPGADTDAWPQQFFPMAKALVEATDTAASYLRSQVKIAVTGKLNREGQYRASENLPKDAYADLVERFWRDMEPVFRDAMAKLRDAPADTDTTIRTAFAGHLRRCVLAIFDEMAGTDDLADRDAKRIVTARATLQGAFGETAKVREALGLVTQQAKTKNAAKRAGKGRAKKGDGTSQADGKAPA